MKHFSRSLASCRDRPLQITNNVRVQIAYEITDVTRHQTHRVVYLCLNMTPGEIKYVLFKMLYSLAAWLSGITTLLEWFEDLLAELARYGKGPGAIGTYLFQTGHEGKKIPQMRRITFYLAFLIYSDRAEIYICNFQSFIRNLPSSSKILLISCQQLLTTNTWCDLPVFGEGNLEMANSL